MKNRIVSLFQLEELLAPRTNGHKSSAAHSGGKKKSKAGRRRKDGPAAVVTPPGKAASPASPAQTPVSKSFDTGAPIHCEHAIAYPQVRPVDLPKSPPAPDLQAQSLGINVEAFEDDDSSIEEPTVRLAADEESPGSESQSVSFDDADDAPAPEAAPRPTWPVPDDAALPQSFAAQMEAVEADLAELARRADHPPPNAPTQPPGEDATPPRRASASPKGHEIFDAMAKATSYATEFRLPPVQLSQVFSALDRELDADVPARAVPDAEPVAAPAAPVVARVPSGDELLRDVMNIQPAEPVGSTVASLGTAIDVRHDVQLVPQQTGYSCWAAGAAMVVGWRDHMSVDPSEIARATGYWAQYASGLNAEDTRMFSVWRLRPEAAQTYTVAGFADLLKRHGPLWVASAEPGPHVRVVTGMVGDGTPTGTLVYINDPWESGMTSFRLPNRGAQYTESYQRFVEKQETLGRQEIKQQGIYVAHA